MTSADDIPNYDFITVEPAIQKPEELWTGKQVITTVLKMLLQDEAPLSMSGRSKVKDSAWGVQKKLPKGSPFSDDEFAENEVLFWQNELLRGCLDKSQFGSSTYGTYSPPPPSCREFDMEFETFQGFTFCFIVALCLISSFFDYTSQASSTAATSFTGRARVKSCCLSLGVSSLCTFKTQRTLAAWMT